MSLDLGTLTLHIRSDRVQRRIFELITVQTNWEMMSFVYLKVRIHGESQTQCISKEVEPEVVVCQWTYCNREGRTNWPVGQLPRQE